jgi:hypothetical protein
VDLNNTKNEDYSRSLKMSILGKANIGLVGLCTLYAVTAVADISVVTRPIDETTGGNWEGTYGSCYSVVPWAPRTVFPEYPIGPDFQSKYVAQYQITEDRSVAPPVPFEPPKDAQCISGPGKAYFDFRIFTAGDPELNPDGNAFVWGFQEPGVNKWSVAAGTQQWNACLNDFYPAGWDSDDVDFEPLSAEIKLTTGGNATVAFYLLSAETTCRSQDYTLFINDSPVANGNVKNLSIGKYLVFDIEGLPEEGSTIRLETKEITGGNDSTYCGIVQSELAENSFVNGIFVDGTDACAPPPPEAVGCRFTGGLNDVFDTGNGENHYRAGGQAGANTALQPQPKGEWTHRQQKGPAGKFTFHAGTASAPLGSEIDVIRCSDPGGCKPSGDPPSPAKQLDFDGIGTFKNIGTKNGNRIPDFVGTANVSVGHGNKNFDGTLHWFEVNIDDLGEPGNTNPKKNPGDANPELCPVNGFGEKGDQELAECSCSDFYRITIYDGVDAKTVPRNPDGSIDKANMNTEDVIYEVWGYIDGGNLQLHHLTGFDLK